MAVWHGCRPQPSFDTHRWSLSSGARSRDPVAMLLRMRLAEDADMIRTSKTLYQIESPTEQAVARLRLAAPAAA
jgi:hypothetical protein